MSTRTRAPCSPWKVMRPEQFRPEDDAMRADCGHVEVSYGG